ncbi:MAG: glycoside hydrolase family 88 protein [Paludibacteraceae bacterium]|nr:glycoside hydrolase family 88 protein [Paludibacteraceae bacterium]
MADAQIAKTPRLCLSDFENRPKWNYTQGLLAHAMLQLYAYTEDTAYLSYVQAYADYFVNSDGTIKTYKAGEYSLDRINAGLFLFDLNRYNPRPEYANAANLLYNQLTSHPRTSEGGYWHKKIYPHQMWLDGLYMAQPFAVRYASEHDADSLYDDVVRQFVIVDRHTRDAKSGLNYHGWDESRTQQWADPQTGCSSQLWGRSIGWYVMALVDVLEQLPDDYAGRNQLVSVLQRVCAGLLKYRDRTTGMWYQVVDAPGRKGNYLESSCSLMFVYAMCKAVRLGYLPESYLQTARQSFDGICRHSVHVQSDGQWSIGDCCAVAGLGGNPYRNGSYEYYVGEPVRDDDPKSVGTFILAAVELARATPHIVVAADGTGDYRTIQEAVNAVPDFRKTRTYIRVKSGVYRERVIIPASKQLLSIIGDGAKSTRLVYGNSAHTIGLSGEEVGTSGSATFYTFADDLYVEGLTIENDAGEVGQAVAAHVSGDRVVFVKCRFIGHQDTLFTYAAGSRQYYKNCYIEGTTDFIFGWSVAVFERCRIHSKRNSYITAASTPQGQRFGYVFHRCSLTADSGVTKCYLGRPWRIYAQTVYVSCNLGAHILPKGWHDWNKPDSHASTYYGEYDNVGAGADQSMRVSWAHRLTPSEASVYTPQIVLSGEDGWNPEIPRAFYRRK